MLDKIKNLLNKKAKEVAPKTVKPKLEEKVSSGKLLSAEEQAFLEDLMCAIDSYEPHQTKEQWRLIVLSRAYLNCLGFQGYDVSLYKQRLEDNWTLGKNNLKL